MADKVVYDDAREYCATIQIPFKHRVIQLKFFFEYGVPVLARNPRYWTHPQKFYEENGSRPGVAKCELSYVHDASFTLRDALASATGKTIKEFLTKYCVLDSATSKIQENWCPECGFNFCLDAEHKRSMNKYTIYCGLVHQLHYVLLRSLLSHCYFHNLGVFKENPIWKSYLYYFHAQLKHEDTSLSLDDFSVSDLKLLSFYLLNHYIGSMYTYPYLQQTPVFGIKLSAQEDAVKKIRYLLTTINSMIPLEQCSEKEQFDNLLAQLDALRLR